MRPDGIESRLPPLFLRRRSLAVPLSGAIDCDVHIALPSTRTLTPFLEPYWADHVEVRGVAGSEHQMGSIAPHAPVSVRPDWKSTKGGLPGSLFDDLKSKLLDVFEPRFAICNCLR